MTTDETDLLALDRALRVDVEHWQKDIANGRDTQLARRALVRSIFAMLEGVIFGLKQRAIETDAGEKRSLSASEVSLGREELADLDDQGRVKTRKANTRFEPNLRFAFSVFAKAHGTSFTLDASGVGWQALSRSVKVRDRITHPKRPSDVAISDMELADMESAYIWFHERFIELFGVVSAARSAQLAELDAEKAKLEERKREIQKERERLLGTPDA